MRDEWAYDVIDEATNFWTVEITVVEVVLTGVI